MAFDLHNFCINERIAESKNTHPDPAVEARIFRRMNDHVISEAAAELDAASNEFNGMSPRAIENLRLQQIRLCDTIDT